MDEESAQVFLPPRERCFERLRLARFGETVTCVHCGDDAVVKRGTTDKDAQQYWCKECETYFSDLTKTIFWQHRFGLEEMFYIVQRFSRSATLSVQWAISRPSGCSGAYRMANSSFTIAKADGSIMRP
jgi:predicted RNA-binding Zn-ribbon protein involved in translation (DUF1610 family)